MLFIRRDQHMVQVKEDNLKMNLGSFFILFDCIYPPIYTWNKLYSNEILLKNSKHTFRFFFKTMYCVLYNSDPTQNMLT
jgi:hypothetical protein